MLAAGASGFNGNLNGNEVGQVFIFTLDQLTRTWQLELQSLQGDGLFGTSIALSGDGTLLVVADRGSGLVQCFKFDGASWVQQNGSINGTVIALSSNGQVIATSSPSSGQGSVTIYKYILQSNYDGYYPSTYGAWQQYGEPIVSADINELFGYSIAINAEGNVVAVGAPKNSDIATFSGKVRIFSFHNESGLWEQMGNDIKGDIQMDQLGTSVALSADGRVVATGLITDDERGGEVRVYSYNVNTPSQPPSTPTSQPTSSPTLQPSTLPSSQPTTSPTSQPTPSPTPEPTHLPQSIQRLIPLGIDLSYILTENHLVSQHLLPPASPRQTQRFGLLQAYLQLLLPASRRRTRYRDQVHHIPRLLPASRCGNQHQNLHSANRLFFLLADQRSTRCIDQSPAN